MPRFALGHRVRESWCLDYCVHYDNTQDVLSLGTTASLEWGGVFVLHQFQCCWFFFWYLVQISSQVSYVLISEVLSSMYHS